MNTVERFPTLEDASRRACVLVRQASRVAVGGRGIFALALSGGSTPRTFLRLLADTQGIDWHKTVVFLVDERMVPPHSEDSNLRQAQELLLNRVSIPEAQIHAPQTGLSPDMAASEYENRIRTFFGPKKPRFDAVQLGMGADGHTASLFPDSELLEEHRRLSVATPAAGAPPVPRVSMTLQLINAARLAFFLVQGEAKLKLLQAMETPSRHFPASLVRPAGELFWLLADTEKSEHTANTEVEII